MSASSRLRWSTWALAAALGAGAVAGHGAPAAAQPAGAKRPAPKKPGKKVDVAAERARLEGRDAAAAVAAAGELGATPDAAAHEALLDALATGLAPQVAAAALVAAGRHPAKGDLAVIGLYARYRDREVRAAAATALGAGAADPGTARALIALLADEDREVRAAAAAAAAAARLKPAIDPLIKLLGKGDDAAAAALAALADVDLARALGELIGQAPDDQLAAALGGILLRKDFGPDPARLEVVRALAKVPGEAAIAALADYVSATPENPPRPSRKEAEAFVEARLGGN